MENEETTQPIDADIEYWNPEARRKKLKPGTYAEDYLRRVMTGAEALRALQLVLLRWHYITGNKYVKQLHDDIPSCDGARQNDWALAIEEMLEEREEYGEKLLPVALRHKGIALEPCNCCDKCRYKKI